MTHKKEDLMLLQDTINSYLLRLETYYLIQLDWFDRQAEIQKIDSYSYELIEIIRPREPKAITAKFLSGYLQAFIDYDKHRIGQTTWGDIACAAIAKEEGRK